MSKKIKFLALNANRLEISLRVQRCITLYVYSTKIQDVVKKVGLFKCFFIYKNLVNSQGTREGE